MKELDKDAIIEILSEDIRKSKEEYTALECAYQKLLAKIEIILTTIGV